MSSFHKQLILNEDTAFYQLVLCAVFVAVVPLIIYSLDLPLVFIAIPVWILLVWCVIEFVVRRYYSVYIENGEIIIYNIFTIKALRIDAQLLEQIALDERGLAYAGHQVFIMHFKNGQQYRFIVGDGVIQLNGTFGIHSTSQAVNAYVNGVVRSFIAGTWQGPSAPFRKKRH